jgi:putative ABC transport system permease protein
LSSELAKKFFGKKEAVGQVITAKILGYTFNYRIGAVYELPAGNTLLDLPAMGFMPEKMLPPAFQSWQVDSVLTYLLFKPGVDVSRVRSQLPNFADRNIDISFLMAGPNVKPSDRLGLDLQNITEQYLNSPFDVTRPGGNKTIILAFTAISILVLLIGSMNFIILTTAKATKRAREVAMRKVLGAKRRQLVLQFMGESFLIVLLSMLISLAAVELVLPLFESLVGKSLGISYSSLFTYFSLATLLLVIGFIGGLYPAFVLSYFRPSRTLKANRSVETKGSTAMRNALVFVQFSVTIALIAATAVIYVQVQFAGSRDPGFNKENLLVINNGLDRVNISGKRETLKREMAALPNVHSVGFSNRQPISTGSNNILVNRQGDPGQPQLISNIAVDDSFFKTYQIPFVAGRDFESGRDPFIDPRLNSIQRDPDADISEGAAITHLILNTRAAKQLGFATAEEAIGSLIVSNNRPFAIIIGVVADTLYDSIRVEPRSQTYLFGPADTNILTVRFKGDPRVVQSQVGKIWKSVTGDSDMRCFFVDQLMIKEFEKERVEAQVLVSFSLLAIIIACLGLFGSTSFAINRRTLEIGMRKVMGAKVKDIVRLLLWQFSRPVLLANLLAWPIAIWAMLRWLERFAYRIDAWILALLCVLSGLIVLFIAWLTVAGNTTRVARANPIHSLRYE